MESWKDVPGFEGLYQWSNIFRFRTVERVIIRSDGIIKKLPSKIMKIQKHKYARLILIKKENGKEVRKHLFIHHFIAEQMIPNPENKRYVNHINGDKLDNRIENLEWSTKSEDVKHAHKTGLIKSLKGIKRGPFSLEQLAKVKRGKDSPMYGKYGELHHYSKLVLDLETGIFYGSIKEAAFAKNYKRNTLSNILSGVSRNKTSFILV